jgi:hypothetical protein
VVSHCHQAAEHPSRIADPLGVHPSDNLELDVIILMGLKFPVWMVGIPDGTPVPERQANNRTLYGTGIRQPFGKVVQMRKAE